MLTHPHQDRREQKKNHEETRPKQDNVEGRGMRREVLLRCQQSCPRRVSR